MTDLLVPVARLARWVDNFSARHGRTTLSVVDGALAGRADDSSRFRATPPFGRRYAGAATVAVFLAECEPPDDWGVLLVRKGGFGIARLAGHTLVDSKTGQRHVQGRTKAGGQSQQRFARRRENQARVAYEAAAQHAIRILDGVPMLVVGGDHAAVDAVLGERRLSSVPVVPPFLSVPDPRRSVLDAAVVDACSVRMDVTNA